MLAVEVRRRSERDEELTAVGLRAGVRHRQDPGAVVPQLRMKLIVELVARAAAALTERVAALDHETLDHAMKNDAVVVRRAGVFLAGLRMRPGLRPLRQAHEVGDGV